MRKPVQQKLVKNMSKPELVAKAAEVGLEVADAKSVKKADLVALIEETIASQRIDKPAAPAPVSRPANVGERRYRAICDLKLADGLVPLGTEVTLGRADEVSLLAQRAIEPI